MIEILMVDDHAIFRSGMRRLLSDEPDMRIVAEAANGQEALDALDASEPGHFDVVLMDIQMPRMDGYKATQAIRHLPDKDKACIPIVAMTANAFEEDKRDAVAAGMNGHIAKPIQIDKLLSMLAEVLRQ